mgnify:CR=1 FL=1
MLCINDLFSIIFLRRYFRRYSPYVLINSSFRIYIASSGNVYPKLIRSYILLFILLIEYPNKDFWKIVKKYPDAKIIVGCDAHSLDALYNDNVQKTYEFIEELGLNVLENIELKK